MLQPTKVGRIAAIGLLVASGTLIGACAGEVTAPRAASVESTSMFVPSAAAKALIGVADGVYKVTFDPKHDQAIALGPNTLSIPENAVCDLATSGYGADYWNRSCKPETKLINLVITIKGASSAHPSMDFAPAMRFNPALKDDVVQLFMYAPHVSKDDAKNWLMFYCPDKGKCVDESLTDNSLVTSIDRKNNMLFRRVKHFSGYTVAERAVDGLLPDGL
ncbi:hypothetical protein BH11GEM1_BH11GEM1_00990 [soil metagenome]